MYDIEFANGKKLTGARANGSGFDCESALTREEITAGLSLVKITFTPESEEDYARMSGEYENMTLGYYGQRGGTLTVILNECDEKERAALQLRADTDYLAMMMGVEL